MQAFFEKKIAPFSKQEHVTIINDAKKIHDAFSLLKEKDKKYGVRGYISDPWPKNNYWIQLFKTISECSIEHTPFDSISHSNLRLLSTTPSFEGDFYEEFRTELELIENNIEEFKKKYATSFSLCLYQADLHKGIQQNISFISDFIKTLCRFQLGERVSSYRAIMFVEFINPVIVLESEQYSALDAIRQKLLNIGNILNKVSSLGYTHLLTEYSKRCFNNFPYELIALNHDFSILINHVELVSIKDGLTSLVEEQIISLMLNVNCLIQGSLPAYLEELQASPEDWSKLCLPRPDYQPKFMTNATITTNIKGFSV